MGDARQIDFGGNTLVVDGIRVGATGPGQSGTELTGAEIVLLDGITAGTAAANKAVVLGASKEIATITSGTITTLTSTTVNSAAITGTTTLTMTSTNAAALAVGRLGATTPAFQVDSSTGSQVAGLKVTGAATAGTVAVVVTDSGANANLSINAKGSGTIGIGSVSTGAVTITPATTVTGTLAATNAATVGTTLGVTGVITPTGGIAAAGGFALSPRGLHTGGHGAVVSTDGSDATPAATETYIAEVFVPYNCTVTGISVFNGSVASGNITVTLANSSGVPVGTQSASTAMSGTDAYQAIALGATYAAVGPAMYLVLMQIDNATARFNTHTLGSFGASKKTGETYGVFTTVTPPTTFTTAVGPIASLY